LTLASSALHPAFPATLALLGAVYVLAGFLYALAPRFLPGLAPTLFHPRKKQP